MRFARVAIVQMRPNLRAKSQQDKDVPRSQLASDRPPEPTQLDHDKAKGASSLRANTLRMSTSCGNLY